MQNNHTKIPAAISRCSSYERSELMEGVERLMTSLSFNLSRGSKVLLKPNLVAAGYPADLACTHPELVAAVAQWFVDKGVHVAVGDSPATGSGMRAMRISKMTGALKNLPVTFAPFREVKKLTTRGGVEVAVAVDALECDYFINLPKLKSHSQARLTLAVKNHYGIVKGWRKAWGHQVHGKGNARPFFDLLADLPSLVPQGISLCDAITAMHVTGPIHGDPYSLGLIAASPSALALDRAFLEVVNLDPELSPLWCASRDYQDPGYDLDTLHFPLLCPDQVQVDDFRVPDHLSPVHFDASHVLGSLAGRFKVWLTRKRDRKRDCY
ncbi:MAG: DUF362 domain-containing protein [Thermodesulfobacteriota bacterium]